MKTHEIDLIGYDAVYKDSDFLYLGTAGSFGGERLHINPDENWKDLIISATFTHTESVTVIADNEGYITVPPEAANHENTDSTETVQLCFGEVVFKGEKEEVRLISKSLPYYLFGHGPAEGENSKSPTPDQYVQFIQQVDETVKRAEAAADRAEAVLEPDPTLITHTVRQYLEENGVQATPLDPTLTKENEAAEAKAVGDALAAHSTAENAHSDLRAGVNTLAYAVEALEENDEAAQFAISKLQEDLEEDRRQIAALESGKQPAGDYLTAESDPTVPAWAKQSTKPVYSYGEVGAAPAALAEYTVLGGRDNFTTHLLDVDLNDPEAYVNRNSVIATEDATTLVDSPITTGAFYAYREVLFINSPTGGMPKCLVRLTEAYPQDGNVWINIYDHNFGVWSGWEWENPPMHNGVEYRLRERWGNGRVYTKLVDCGGISDGKSITVISEKATVFRWDAVVDNSIPLPTYSKALSSTDYCELSFSKMTDRVNVVVKCGSNLSGKNLKVRVWYIKQ